MFETFGRLLHNDAFLFAYLVVFLCVLVLPMLVLARWYHGNINKSAGGRALMGHQNAGRVGPRSLRGVGDSLGMARDITSGRYGREAMRMQNRVYAWALAWLLAVGVIASLMIVAMDQYPRPGINGRTGERQTEGACMSIRRSV